MLYTDNWILQDTFLGVYLTLGSVILGWFSAVALLKAGGSGQFFRFASGYRFKLKPRRLREFL